MESRQAILDRLRELRKVDGTRSRSSSTPEMIFADIPAPDRAALIDHFTKKLVALRGEVFTVASFDAAARKVAELTRASELSRCGRQRAPLLDQLFGSQQELAFLENEMTIVDGSTSLPHSAVESMQCAFTVADALIARTGSIVLRATTAGGRRLSVLPPIHCVIATADQLVPCLSTWLSETHQDRTWSYSTIITGPSRTADIERILVLGAHGPKRLIVIVIDGH